MIGSNKQLSEQDTAFVIARLFEAAKTPEELLKNKQELEASRKPHNAIIAVNIHEVMNAFAMMFHPRDREGIQSFWDLVEKQRS